VNPRKIPLEDRDRIESLYKKLNSIPKIAEIYGVAGITVWRYLKRHNIETRPKGIKAPTYRKINENAFNVLNENSEYWMGFLYADGNISLIKTINQTTKQFSCFLQTQDKKHIQKCLDFLETDYKIKLKKSRGANLGYLVKGELFGFQITNPKLVDDLISHGFTTKKSESGSITNENLLNSRHFWRGLIDGDGSIGFISKAPSFSLIANEEMMGHFYNYIYREVLFDKIFRTAYQLKSGQSFAHHIHFEYNDAKLLVDHFYSNCTIYLDRKMEKAKKIHGWVGKRKPINHEEHSKIADMLLRGFKIREILEELDFNSKSAIHSTKITIGLPIKKRKQKS